MGFRWELTAAALKKSWGAASPTAQEGLVCRESIIQRSSPAVLPHAMHSPHIPVGAVFWGGLGWHRGCPGCSLAAAAQFLP